jgi:predicted transcriptional regulator
VSEIEKIRAKNNILWMNILRIALGAEPILTKSILHNINLNDRRISDALGRLADE